jgi:tripartite-type tricarboxylate transporter receptor subunit TctC
MSKRELLTTTLVIGVGLATISSAFAQSYPSRPVQLVVPFSGGSGTDIAARGLAEGLAAQLGQAAVVVNREGASGTMALAAVAQAAPDGYTLAFTPQGPLTIQPHLKPNLPYGLDTFQPLCQVFEDSFGILVRPTSPIADFKALLDRARAKPKSLTFGSLGVATVAHLQVEGLALAAGVAFVHAPYRGFGQLIADTLGGTLDFAVSPINAISGGNGRVIAVLGPTRSPRHPAVPTVDELGFRVSMPGIGGLYAPKAAPAAVHDRLEAACAKAFASESFQNMAANAGTSPVYLPRAAFAERLAADSREKAALIKALNIKTD